MAGCQQFAEVVEKTTGPQLYILRTIEPNENNPTKSIPIDKEQAASMEDAVGYNNEELVSSFSSYNKPIRVQE
jgi:hypothetical protein